jgi:hypothetical protein
MFAAISIGIFDFTCRIRFCSQISTAGPGWLAHAQMWYRETMSVR